MLFEEPPNTLSALFKYPEHDYFTDVLPKLTITFMVRDWNDSTWVSVGHKIRFTLSTRTREPFAEVLPDKEKTDEILQISLVPRKKSRMYLAFTMRFAVFGTPYPLWNWTHADVFAAGVETSQLRLEVFEATYNMYVSGDVLFVLYIFLRYSTLLTHYLIVIGCLLSGRMRS